MNRQFRRSCLIWVCCTETCLFWFQESFFLFCGPAPVKMLCICLSGHACKLNISGISLQYSTVSLLIPWKLHSLNCLLLILGCVFPHSDFISWPPTLPHFLPPPSHFFVITGQQTLMRMKMYNDRQNRFVCHRYLRDGTELIKRGSVSG